MKEKKTLEMKKGRSYTRKITETLTIYGNQGWKVVRMRNDKSPEGKDLIIIELEREN